MKIVGLHLNNYKNVLDSGGGTHISAMDSSAHVVLEPQPGEVADLKRRNPKAVVGARPYVRDQDLHRMIWDNPEGAAEWAAQKCEDYFWRAPEADYWIVLNEPPGDSVEWIKKIARFDVSFIRAMKQRSKKAGIGAWSTGNIQIPAEDGGAAIRAYEPAFREAAAEGCPLVIHCYAACRPLMGGIAPNGWHHNPDYYGLRWHRIIFPWMRAHGIPIPITYVTEFGLDLGFAKSDGGYTGATVGYRTEEPWGYGTSEAGARQYARDLVPFAVELADDPQVQGICIYAAGDNGTSTWWTFLVHMILHILAATAFPSPKGGTQVEKVRLRIPLAVQLGPLANYANGDCLQACLTGLIKAFVNPNITVNQVAEATGLPRGYTASHIITHGVNLAARYGLRMLWAGNVDAEDLREELRAHRSVILRVWYPYLKKKYDASYNGYHFITVHGFEGNDFFIDDPYWARIADAEDIRISADDLMRASHYRTGGGSSSQALFLRGGRTLPVAEGYEVAA